jgi:hypothetical protein
MAKKCIICGDEAKFQVKDTNNYYCDSCAETLFSDTKLLLKVEQEATRLKKFIDEKLP